MKFSAFIPRNGYEDVEDETEIVHTKHIQNNIKIYRKRDKSERCKWDKSTKKKKRNSKL